MHCYQKKNHEIIIETVKEQQANKENRNILNGPGTEQKNY